MARENETRVFYKAIADFSQLSRAAAKAKADLATMRKAEETANKSSMSADRNRRNLAKSTSRDVKSATQETEGFAKAMQNSSETLKTISASRVKEVKNELQGAATKAREADNALGKVKNKEKDFKNLGNSIKQAGIFSGDLKSRMDKFNNLRLHLMPPFVALVPIVAAVLALVNPLVAGIGSLGTGALALAGNIGSLAGASLAVVPGLTALLTVVGALKTAFAGFTGAQGVFKAYSAMQKSGGGSGGASAIGQLTQTEDIVRSQERYRRSIEDVTFAQEDLNKAREEYNDKLKTLLELLNDANKAEGLARDRARLSAEYVAQISDNTDVSQSDKQAAADFASYMQDQYEEAQKSRAEADKQYQETKQTSVEQDRGVIEAKRRVTDATWAQRDAELGLKKAQAGGSSGGSADATQKFQEALDKLSPSARIVAGSLIALWESWKKVRTVVQESFFSKIVGDMGSLEKLLPGIVTLFSDAAGAAGGISSKFLQFLGSSSGDLGAISAQNVKLIGSFGDGFISLAESFRDITVAAGPFAVALGDSFSKGLSNFATLISTAKTDGSLANWLETVRERLSQWWQIVKNVGSTLYNYGAAAAPLGQWITDGLEKMTKAWSDASKKARIAGSPFQSYLEASKGPLTETRKLFGDFFSWFAKESKNKESQDAFVGIIKSIREDLGPALGKLLDALTKSDIGTGLVVSLAQIIDTLADFSARGAGAGFLAFFQALTEVFKVLNSVVNFFPEPVIKGLVGLLGTLAALSFVRFLGMLSVVKAIAAGDFFFKMAQGIGAFYQIVRAEGFIKGIKAIGAIDFVALRQSGEAAKVLGTGASSASTGVGRLGGALGGLSRFLGPIAIALALATAAFIYFKSASGKTAEVNEDLVASFDEVTGAITKTTRVLVFNSLVADGAIDAAKHLGIGLDVVTSAALGNKDAMERVNSAIEVHRVKNAALVDQYGASAEGVFDSQEAITTLTFSIGAQRGELTGSTQAWKDQKLAVEGASTATKDAADSLEGYRTALKKLAEDQQGKASKVFKQRTSEDRLAASQISAAEVLIRAQEELNTTGALSASTQMDLSSAQQGVAESAIELANANSDLLSSTGDLAGAGRSYNDTILQGTSWTLDYANQVRNLSGVGDTAAKTLRDMQAVSDALNGTIINVQLIVDQSQWDKLLASFAEHPEIFTSGKGFAGINGVARASTPAPPPPQGGYVHSANGGMIYRANGGDIPGYVPGSGNSDSVDAKLTPGEFVIRKAIASKVGPENLSMLNSGVMSFTDMLRRAQEAEGQGAPSSPSSGTFSFQPKAISFGTPPSSPRKPGGSDGSSGPSYSMSVVINNPVGVPSEESIIRAGQEASFMAGWGG